MEAEEIPGQDEVVIRENDRMVAKVAGAVTVIKRKRVGKKKLWVVSFNRKTTVIIQGDR